MARPAHDDVKDAMASAVDIAIPPAMGRKRQKHGNVIFNARFGGVAA